MMLTQKSYFQIKIVVKPEFHFFKDEIIYTDLQSKIKLKLTGQEKKIDKFNCQEAKIDLNGRKYTVWFAPNINVSFGPYKLNGIPGLIVSITESTNKLKITLKKIHKFNDTANFNKLKKYISSKKVLTYTAYEEKAIKVICNKKRKEIAIASEYNATVNYSNDQLAFTKYLIDIPANLVSELQKIN